MSAEPITVCYQGSQLLVVPAIHFSYVFASEVNRICRNPETRPEAIAIELGPQTAEAAERWLKELGVGPKKSRELPVMLGLTKRNRMIRGSLKQKAFQLQKETGNDLSELPPEVLNRELGYAGYGLLCLSPTDSIIEAIRCALELDLPLYGIDLEEMADGNRKPIIVQDPIGADGNLAAYIAQNAPYAAQQHDEEIDSRREVVMAARVKALLEEYRRVLFTCGMGHWLRIRNMFEDPSIRPSIIPKTTGETLGYFKRVVVHPLIAINYMGLFPALVAKYEKARKPPCELDGRSNRAIRLHPFRIFEDLMRKTCRDYFSSKSIGQECSHRSQDLNSLGGFEGYLKNLCLVNLRLVPDFLMTTKAAQGMMSKGFVRALTKRFMDFPWASPEEHLECSLLASVSGYGDDSVCTLYGNDGLGNEEYFYVRSIPASKKHTVKIKIPYEWAESNELKKKSKGSGMLHTWIPWDYLISSMSLRGVGLAKKWEHERRAEVFEGSLLEGIDIKQTLRAYSRGEDRLYVWDTLRKRSNSASFPGDGFPVVFILEPGEHGDAEWTALYEECSWMAKHMSDRTYFDETRRGKGDKMIAVIGYGDLDIDTKASELNSKIRSDRYYGIVIYQPICWTRRQFAKWVELTGYKRNPFCNSNILGEGLTSDLTAFFEKRNGIRIGEFQWSTTLMLLAIPFAKDIVTVIIPDNYQIDRVVFEKAKRYGVEVCEASLNSFTQQEIDRLSFNHMAAAITHDPKCVFPKSVEKAIGELQTDNRDLVPRSCLDFGNH